MLPAVYALAAIALSLVVLRARPAVVLLVLAVAVFVVPGPLLVPYTGANYLTFHHVLTLAGGVRVGVGLLDGTVTRRDLRIAAPQMVLAVLVAVAVVGGIALAPDAGDLGAGSFRFVDLLDQLAFLTVVVVLARQAGRAAVLRALAAALAAGILIATVEQLTSMSWGRLLFSPFPLGSALSAAYPLSERAGTLRVRAGTEFALQFGWLAASAAPALVVVALRLGRRRGPLLAWTAALLSVAVVYWSFSRTALVAVLVTVALSVLSTRNRAMVTGLGAASVAAAAAYLFLPSVQARFAASSGSGSLAVRQQRLAPAMEAASRHPFKGTGLGQLITAGIPTTDQAFLLEYLELGVVGAVVLLLVLVSALLCCVRACAAASSADRDLVAAAALGVLAFVASCFAYDAATLVQGTHLLWLLVAAALAVELPATRRRGVQETALRTVVAASAGLLLGTVVYAVAPVHSAQRSLFTTLPAEAETTRPYDPVSPAQTLVGTVCATARATAADGVGVDCTDRFGPAGEGFLRLEAPTQFALQQASDDLVARVRDDVGLADFVLLPLEPVRSGRDTWALTAPVWAALGAAGLIALLVPGGRPPWPARRRAERGASPPTTEPLTPAPLGTEDRQGASRGPAPALPAGR